MSQKAVADLKVTFAGLVTQYTDTLKTQLQTILAQNADSVSKLLYTYGYRKSYNCSFYVGNLSA
jgi:hypothetical protein